MILIHEHRFEPMRPEHVDERRRRKEVDVLEAEILKWRVRPSHELERIGNLDIHHATGRRDRANASQGLLQVPDVFENADQNHHIELFGEFRELTQMSLQHLDALQPASGLDASG